MSKPKMIDRISKLEKSDKYHGIAVWVLVFGLAVEMVLTILTQTLIVK